MELRSIWGVDNEKMLLLRELPNSQEEEVSGRYGVWPKETSEKERQRLDLHLQSVMQFLDDFRKKVESSEPGDQYYFVDQDSETEMVSDRLEHVLCGKRGPYCLFEEKDYDEVEPPAFQVRQQLDTLQFQIPPTEEEAGNANKFKNVNSNNNKKFDALVTPMDLGSPPPASNGQEAPNSLTPSSYANVVSTTTTIDDFNLEKNATKEEEPSFLNFEDILKANLFQNYEPYKFKYLSSIRSRESCLQQLAKEVSHLDETSNQGFELYKISNAFTKTKDGNTISCRTSRDPVYPAPYEPVAVIVLTLKNGRKCLMQTDVEVLRFQRGTAVVMRFDNGEVLGLLDCMAKIPRPVTGLDKAAYMPMLRVATIKDFENLVERRNQEERILKFCNTKSNQTKEMLSKHVNFVDAEYLLDQRVITLFSESDSKYDWNGFNAKVNQHFRKVFGTSSRIMIQRKTRTKPKK